MTWTAEVTTEPLATLTASVGGQGAGYDVGAARAATGFARMWVESFLLTRLAQDRRAMVALLELGFEQTDDLTCDLGIAPDSDPRPTADPNSRVMRRAQPSATVAIRLVRALRWSWGLASTGAAIDNKEKYRHQPSSATERHGADLDSLVTGLPILQRVDMVLDRDPDAAAVDHKGVLR